EQTLNEYVATAIGPLWPELMKLHQFLVDAGSTAEAPFDFGYADRHGVAFADEAEWKSMALCTQNYTYMVVLVRRESYLWPDEEETPSSEEKELELIEAWEIVPLSISFLKNKAQAVLKRLI